MLTDVQQAPVLLADGRCWPVDFPSTNEAGPDGRTWWERDRAAHALEEIRRRARRHQAIASLPRVARRRAEAAERRRCTGSGEFDLDAFGYWCNSYGWVRAEKESSTGSPVAGVPPQVRDMPFLLWPDQREAAAWLLERLRSKDDALIPKSREVGITWLALHLIVWLWAYHGGAYLLGSRKDELVDKLGDMRSLFERSRYILDRLPPYLRPSYTTKNKNLQRKDDLSAQINGESTNSDFARSGRYRLIFVDEYGAIEPVIARAIIRSISSAGPCWFVYNPAGERHPSYRLYTSFPAHKILQLRWTSDPYRPPDFFALQLVEHGGKLTRAEAEREWNCNHRDISEGLIFEWSDAIEYDESSPDWAELRDTGARDRWVQLGGWDFGAGTSLTVAVVCLLQMHADHSVTLWFDDCRFWSQQHHAVVAEEALKMIREYGKGPGGAGYRHVGDPAGRQRDAGQGSWESYLRSAGINIDCLEAAFNAFESQEWAIRNAKYMMARLRVRVHKTKCAPLIQSLKQWRRKVPDGKLVIDVNGRVAPMKDGPSHGSQAYLYALDGAVKYLRAVAAEKLGQPLTDYSGAGAEERTHEALASFYADRPLGGFWAATGGLR